MPRNVVVLLDNAEGRAMIKEACKEQAIDGKAHAARTRLTLRRRTKPKGEEGRKRLCLDPPNAIPPE